MAAAELVANPAQRSSFLYFYAREMVGVAFSVDGSVHTPSAGPPVIGHFPIGATTLLDPHRTGQLEAATSDTGIVAAARAAGLEISEIAEVHEAARDGNETARDILTERAEVLGRAVALIADIFNPDHVVLGGQAFTDAPQTLPVVARVIRDTSVTAKRDVRVSRAGSPCSSKQPARSPSTRSTPIRSVLSRSPGTPAAICTYYGDGRDNHVCPSNTHRSQQLMDRLAMGAMTIPTEPVAIPERVRLLARGAALSCLWANELGGLTFLATAADGEDFVIKVGSTQPGDFHARRGRAPPLGAGVDPGPDGDRPGRGRRPRVARHRCGPSRRCGRAKCSGPAVARRSRDRGARSGGTARDARLAAGPGCPWEWSVTNRIAGAAERAITVPDHLREAPPPDRLVVCHGDACCPNTLMGDGGRWVAHVDLTRPDPRACTASAIPRRSMLGCRNRVGSRFSRWCGGSTR